MVEYLLNEKIRQILDATGGTNYQLYITEGDTFRYALAKTRPYKGNREDNKPYNFKNLTSHMTHMMGARVVRLIEADDQLAIDHLDPSTDTVLCSRDKDLRQVPGKFYSWELGHQPAYGPLVIDHFGDLHYEGGKLSGSGFLFFCAQLIMGDRTDNIPGLLGKGPAAAWELLGGSVGFEDALEIVRGQYDNDEYLLEQGRLCWITRRLHEDGSPVLWNLEMIE
jgi:hypothetical protein